MLLVKLRRQNCETIKNWQSMGVFYEPMDFHDSLVHPFL
jgi:hypothetical protein